MDNLSAQLNKILSDPSSMEQIKNIMGSMGGQIPEDLGANTPPPSPAPIDNNINMELMGAMAKIAPMLGSMKQDDNTTRLLGALRPMLSDKKQKKVDEALKILQILRMLPMLKESGILSSIFG